MLQPCFVYGARKYLDGRFTVFSCWNSIHYILCHLHCIWPQVRWHCLWPSSCCVQHHGLRCILQVPDAFFCNTILKMSVDSAVSNGLPLSLNVLDECSLGKTSIIGMLLPHFYPKWSTVSFKCLLSLQGVICCQCFLEVDVSHLAVMVHKDCGGWVSTLSGYSFHVS